MNDNNKILNDLETAKKQLEEGLQNEFDPQIRMEYEEELKSIVEQIEEMQNNYEITSDSDEELEDKDNPNSVEEEIDDELEEEKNEPSKHILKRMNDIVNDLENAKLEDVSELLGYYNGEPVVIDGMAYHPFNDPVFAAKINARYYELTGENHPTFVEQSPKLIDSLMQDKDMLLKSGAYPQEYFDQLNKIKNNLNINPNIELNNEFKEEKNEDNSNSVEEELNDKPEEEKNEDENIIDAEYYEIHDIDSNEKLSQRAARLAKDYTLAQAENLKINAKTFAHNKTEQAKNYVHTKVDNAKNAVLNSRPVRFARGVKNVGKKVFRGFKTAGTIALGVGALSVEAVQRAKNTVEKVGPESLKNIVNTGRENANSLLDKLEDKVMSKQLEVIEKQQKLEQEMSER